MPLETAVQGHHFREDQREPGGDLPQVTRRVWNHPQNSGQLSPGSETLPHPQPTSFPRHPSLGSRPGGTDLINIFKCLTNECVETQGS